LRAGFELSLFFFKPDSQKFEFLEFFPSLSPPDEQLSNLPAGPFKLSRKATEGEALRAIGAGRLASKAEATGDCSYWRSSEPKLSSKSEI